MAASGTDGRGLRSLVFGLTAVALLLTAFAPSASAQTRRDLLIDVRPGFDGLVRQGTATPLAIAVQAGNLFSGTLEVVVQTSVSTAVLRQPIEVPGGSRKLIRLVAPRSEVLDVRLLDRRGRVAARTGSPPATLVDTGAELIGVLSIVPTTLRRVEIVPLGRDGRVVPVPQEMLDLGASALRALSHLVVDADAARTFSERQREAVLGFTAAGGELVVAAAGEADLAFLPEPWRGAGGGAVRRTRVGDASVTVALSPLSSADWAERGQMWPAAIRPAAVDRWRGDELGSHEWLGALSESGRFRRATLGWLLAFVLGYVAIAGPINFVVLARLRRRELAWVTVPVLAILFAAGAYVIGQGVRNVSLIQGTGIVVADADAERTTLALGVLSRSGGRETIDIPAGWLAEPVASGRGDGSNATGLRLTRDGSVAEFTLPVGDVGTTVAHRTAVRAGAAAPPLVLRDDRIEGTVTNTTAFDLTAPAVAFADAVQRLPELAPQQRTPVELSVPFGGQRFEFEDEELVFRLQSELEAGWGPGFGGGSFQLLQRARRITGLGDQGRAFLLGWADLEKLAPTLGFERGVGQVLVVIPLGIRTDAATIPAASIRRSLVATDGHVNVDPGFPFVQQAREVVTRFELPEGARPDRVRLTLAEGFLVPHVEPHVEPEFDPELDPQFQVEPQPPQHLGGDLTVEVYDVQRGTWRTGRVEQGRVEMDADAVVSSFGEVLVRISSEFARSIPLATLRLEGVAS